MTETGWKCIIGGTGVEVAMKEYEIFGKVIHDSVERDLGEQPIVKLMVECGLKPGDLVNSSTEQITYKMVSRAVKGRRLTPSIQQKILSALNKAAGKQYVLKDLFNY
jgi:hypothetical protein